MTRLERLQVARSDVGDFGEVAQLETLVEAGFAERTPEPVGALREAGGTPCGHGLRKMHVMTQLSHRSLLKGFGGGEPGELERDFGTQTRVFL